MASFSCPHYDEPKDYCRRLATDCVPGRRGCVLPKDTGFLIPAEERVRLKEEEKRQFHSVPMRRRANARDAERI